MERIERILKEAGIENYFIKTVLRDSTELFFIGDRLDLKRINHSGDSVVSVYIDSEKEGVKLRGRSDVIVDASMTDDELREKLNSARLAAGYALNPYYDLACGTKGEPIITESDLNGLDTDEIVKAFVDAVYSQDAGCAAFINNLELFVNETRVSYKGTNGTDISYVKRKVTGEFVVQCIGTKDVETYRNFSYDSMAIPELKKLVSDTLKMTEDRVMAEKMPKTGRYDLVISDQYMPELLSFFTDRANAAYVYQKYSNYEVGKDLQNAPEGDRLNIRFGVTDPVNDEGIRMAERPFIEDGVVKTLHGSQRFSDYLKLPKIGTYEKLIVPAGPTEADELKKGCLHVVNFSDFQMDSLDGHFKGEIRLAYLYGEDGSARVLTGGSVNGSILEGINSLYFSKETQRLSNYEGPVAVKIKNVLVSGE